MACWIEEEEEREEEQLVGESEPTAQEGQLLTETTAERLKLLQNVQRCSQSKPEQAN